MEDPPPDLNMRLKLRYHYAFAIIKVRVLNGNEKKTNLNRFFAIEVMLNKVINCNKYCSPKEKTDHLALVGRIYKDIYTDSRYRTPFALYKFTN